jgi:hypothetical protein
MKVSTMRRIGLGIWSHMGAPSRQGWGENWGGPRSATATYRQFGERERQQPTFPHLASFPRPREAGGRAAVRQRRAPSHWLRGSLGTRASLLGEKSGSPRGVAKVGGNVGCRVPVRG